VALPDPAPESLQSAASPPRPGRSGADVLADAATPDTGDVLDPDAEVFRQITAATSEPVLKAIWRTHKATWTTNMTAAYQARRTEITGKGRP
jgi:hypothetical protein